MTAALRFRDVHFAYPQREPVLAGVTLDVPEREMTVVLGPNGAGKTTLLRIAAGLVAPPRGEVALADGTSARRASRAGRIGYIPQHLGLVHSATAFDNAALGGIRRVPALPAALGLLSREVRDDTYAALDAVGLREKASMRVKSLSGGEKQRVAIARTLVQRPQVIVADELIASLDAVQSHAVMELQRSLRTRGVTMLVSLHHIDVALANADHVCFLSRGRLSAPRRPEGMTSEEARCALVA